MMTAPQGPQLLPDGSDAVTQEGIDLLAIFASYLVEWRLFVSTFAVVMVLCIVITFLLRPQFIAQCSILPQMGRSDNDLSSLFSYHTPGSLYVGLLQSRSVSEVVIDQAHLLDLFHTSSREKAITALQDKTTITSGTDSIVTIKVKDPSAKEAALIANAYLIGLEHLNTVMSQDASRQAKEFFQTQLQQEKDDLGKAETELAQTQKQTGIIQPETQTLLGLNAIAATRNQITALEVQLAALLQSDTEENPQVRLLRSQIAQLQASESKLEMGSSATPVGAAPSAGQMPESNLDFLRAQRDVRYHDAIVSGLSNQYEVARLSEDVSRPNFQIVDRAVVPEFKSWPPRRLLVLFGLVMGLILAFVVVAAKLVYFRLVNDPRNQPSLLAIQQALARR
jgi:uncharacterized protein involved in exopolysaccharide biosynthesis